MCFTNRAKPHAPFVLGWCQHGIIISPSLLWRHRATRACKGRHTPCRHLFCEFLENPHLVVPCTYRTIHQGQRHTFKATLKHGGPRRVNYIAIRSNHEVICVRTRWRLHCYLWSQTCSSWNQGHDDLEESLRNNTTIGQEMDPNKSGRRAEPSSTLYAMAANASLDPWPTWTQTGVDQHYTWDHRTGISQKDPTKEAICHRWNSWGFSAQNNAYQFYIQGRVVRQTFRPKTRLESVERNLPLDCRTPTPNRRTLGNFKEYTSWI